jgi:hypothetical protein
MLCSTAFRRLEDSLAVPAVALPNCMLTKATTTRVAVAVVEFAVSSRASLVGASSPKIDLAGTDGSSKGLMPGSINSGDCACETSDERIFIAPSSLSLALSSA